MAKYFQLGKITFQTYFAYRLNFYLWRFRNLVFFLSLFFFWSAVYQGKASFMGYQRPQMFAYLVGIAFLKNLVLSSRLGDLGWLIRNGGLTNIVLAPLNIFSYWFTKEAVDKVSNLVFGLIELGLILLIFDFPFYFPQNLSTYFYFSALVILALFLHFFINFFLSCLAFWTDDIWATRFLFGVIFLNFFAGAFFPIDVLPSWLTRVIYFTPFPYLIFFPLKVWLEQLSLIMVYQALAVSLVWLVFFYWLSQYLWKKGIKNYGAYGD